MRYFLFPLILFFLSMNAFAIGVDKDRLNDPLLEARAQQMMKQLRCLVCQNQSIVDSDAGLAEDLRAIVREQVMAGKSDPEIIAFMTSRYGDWVLLMPPFKMTTLFLWLGPFILLLVGGFLVFRYVSMHKSTPEPRPLNADEEKRLNQILKGSHK
ncbi:MAG: cytochrome c-type biogenesis protein CcmH [Emcibacter sp.]|nr:cytochrome c-type biogenesis protein CcmH [Emcibacter sp.]